MIYHNGWSLCLKQKYEKHDKSQTQAMKRRRKSDTPCWRFNKGRGSFGSSCRFEHKCANCSKTDHGASSCSRKEKDKDKKP